MNKIMTYGIFLFILSRYSIIGAPINFGASYTYFFDYFGAFTDFDRADIHYAAINSKYSFVPGKVDVGISVGSELNRDFDNHSYNYNWSYLYVGSDTAIYKCDRAHQSSYSDKNIIIGILIDFKIRSFFIEVAPDIGLNYLSRTTKSSSIYSYFTSSDSLTPFDTTSYSGSSNEISTGTSTSIGVGYQVKHFQFKLLFKTFDHIGLSMTYFIFPQE